MRLSGGSPGASPATGRSSAPEPALVAGRTPPPAASPAMADWCLKRLGLSHNPFVMAPNIVNFYSPVHIETMLVEVLHLIETRMGFGLLYGDVGLGKTTVSRRILFELDRRGIHTALVFNTFFQGAELVGEINRDFGVVAPDLSLQGQMTALNQFLLEQRARDNNCVIILDDAQNLSVESLELIRQISNMETGIDKIVQIILVGQPELAEKLNLYALRQLKSRIVLTRAFRPYTRKETGEYIHSTIARGGDRLRLEVSAAAMRRVHEASGGISRRINVIMGRCLYCAVAENTHVISRRIVNMAVRDVRESIDPASGARPGRRALWAAALAVLLAVPALAYHVQRGSAPVAAVWLEPVGRMTDNLVRSIASAAMAPAAGPAAGAGPQAPQAPGLAASPAGSGPAPPPVGADADATAPARTADRAVRASAIGASQPRTLAGGDRAPGAANTAASAAAGALAAGAAPPGVNPAVLEFLQAYGLAGFAVPFEAALRRGRLAPVAAGILAQTGLRLVALPGPVAGLEQAYAMLQIGGGGSDGATYLLFWEPVQWPADSFEEIYRPRAVRALQTALSRNGVYRHDVNGAGDADTVAALREFQRAVGLPATGLPDVETLFLLEFLDPRRRAVVAESRGPAPPAAYVD